jgi:hypothetical protein
MRIIRRISEFILIAWRRVSQSPKFARRNYFSSKNIRAPDSRIQQPSYKTREGKQQKIRAFLPVEFSASNWNSADVRQWATDLRLVRADRLDLFDDELTGQLLMTLDEGTLVAKGFTKEEARA